MTPLDTLLGTEGDPRCKSYGADVSVHWFAADTKPGDRCLCGEVTMNEPYDWENEE